MRISFNDDVVNVFAFYARVVVCKELCVFFGYLYVVLYLGYVRRFDGFEIVKAEFYEVAGGERVFKFKVEFVIV